MATKNFSNFTNLTQENDNPILKSDFLVGYHPSDSISQPAYEIRVSASELMNTSDDLMSPLALKGDKIQFNPTGVNYSVNSVNVKLNKFKDVEDYQDATSAGVSSYNQRLFVPVDKTVILTPNINQTNALAVLLASIKNWHIEGLVQINLSSTSGVMTWTLNDSLNLNHPFGQNIQIIGNLAVPSNVIINITGLGNNNITPSFNLLSCTDGHVFGLINGVTIQGNYNPVSNPNSGTVGVLADAGAQIKLGSAVVITNCKYGIKASRGSKILADGVSVSGCGSAGIYATSGSHISAQNSISSLNNVNGFLSEYNSQIHCPYSQSLNNSSDGYVASHGAQLHAVGAKSNNNAGSGFLARYNGEIDCSSVTSYKTQAISNSRYGVEFDGVAKIYGDFSDMASTGGSVSPNVTLTSTADSSFFDKQNIISSNAPLAIKTSNGDSILFQTSNSNTQLAVEDNTSTTSYLGIKGGTNDGENPTITLRKTSNWGSLFPPDLIIDAGDGYLNLGGRVKYTAPFVKPAPGDPNLIPNGYISCLVGNKTVYLLMHEV